MDVVIVESPAKAKTINKYLGSNYKVLASYGHVRDLPSKDGSVLPDEDFAMSWSTDAKSSKRLTEIVNAVKEADGVILATDPDREGEAISWHVLEVLNSRRAIKSKPVKRVVFNAITKNAVLEAMKNPRDIDMPLVNAYLARRALDYLVGFSLSPILWRKLPGARSAGRVQSVSLRLICDREAEIERFIREEYWQVAASLKTPSGEGFQTRLVALDGQKLDKLSIKTGDEAADIKTLVESAAFTVASVEAKPVRRNPSPPFTTSTLQQAASSRLGFSASRTMQTAQRLYEGLEIDGEAVGLITYMRTDGVQMAPEGIADARKMIGATFGDKYLPEKAKHYETKAKNAQEAHEAVRPTDFSRHPKDMKKFLDTDQARLYEIIWQRAIASQMNAAELERTTVEIEARKDGRVAGLRANGQVVRFDGFFAAYAFQKEEDAKDTDDNDDERRLPLIVEGEVPSLEGVEATQHSTEPPPRYSEASLIKKMEELGIGRPSTYAATIQTLRDRDYVEVEQRKMEPASRGRLVTAFLENFFSKYVEYDFTASLEAQLDDISAGKLEWKDVLQAFWKDFSATIDETKELRITAVLDALNEALAPVAFPQRQDGGDPRKCPVCSEGNLSLKIGRYGSFVGCSNYPECGFTRQLGETVEEAQAKALAADGDALGQDPHTGEDVYLKSGRFGPYVQRGEGKESKKTGIPKGWAIEEVDFEKALALLSLPRDIGQHPETGAMISAGLGRYGPFVLCDGVYANMEDVNDVFSIGLNRAVTLIEEKKLKGGGRGRAAAKPLKELGEYPEIGGPVAVKDGKYGPYVSHGKINATLPKDKDPQSVTMEEAVAMLLAKAEKTGKTIGGAKKAPAKKKPAAKKPATKKNAPAKKPTTKKKAEKPKIDDA